MGLKENQYYDRDLVSYPVIYRQKKNINSKKSTDYDLKLRKRNAKAHERNVGRQHDRMKKYSNHQIDDDSDSSVQLQDEKKNKPGKTSPTSIETSSIDLHSDLSQPERGSSYTTPKKPTSKYHTPVKNDLGKYITPSKMPRQTSGGEVTPTKSPFSETLPDGILSSPVSVTPLKSLSVTTPIQKRANALSPPPGIQQHNTPHFFSQYTPDVVSRSIFQALFGASPKNTSSIPWDEEDDEDGDDIGGDDLYQCKSVEPVDELWFTRLLSTSLLTTQALDYALGGSTSFFQQQINRGNPIGTPEELLSNYINPTFITSLIAQLPFEDERFTSPRLSVLKAIYKAVPKFRYLIAQSLLSVSNQRFMRCKTSSKLATMYELDVNHTGTKIGDMYSYSIPEHVDMGSAYNCFPIDDIPYPPRRTCSLSMPPTPSLAPQISTQQQPTTATIVATRDHDISIIELNLFMIITSEYDMNENTSRQSLYRIFLSIIITVLRCYGRRLGKTTEGVEQPNVLKSCLRALEEITNRVHDDEVENIIVPAILHSWPGGGNSVREAAFLKALGIVLPHCNPKFISNPVISSSTSLTGLSTKSLTLPQSSSLYKTLTRVLLCLNSIHFKVCQESIQLLFNEKILSHYLYDTEVCRHLLDLLVNALRQNRNHWNTSVRQASETCMDQIFELME